MNLIELRNAYQKGDLEKQAYIEKMYAHHQELFDYAEILKNSGIEKIEVTDDGVVTTFRKLGIKMFCRAKDRRLVPWEAINFGAFEAIETKNVLELVSPEATVFDIGANVGFYSLVIANQYPSSQIHAFEPVPSTFAYLKRNKELNQAHNISLHQFGFAEIAKEVPIYFYEEGLGNSSLANLSQRPSVSSVTVPMETVDGFVERTGNKPHFIKCDVEGAELLVLQGAQQTLTEYRPILFLELLRKWSAAFHYHPQEVVLLLKKLGYRSYAVGNNGLSEITTIDDHTVETNFFFLPSRQ